MPALGCQSVSASFPFSSWVRRSALPAATGLLAAVLTACAPLPPQADGAFATNGETDTRAGAPSNAGAQSKGAPSRNGRESALNDLGWPEVDQKGVASWYGPRFHGRKTANGERYNQYELTAAHPKYAFNTQLCVRNPGNGKTVVVRVNDRGPYVGKRVIDLSKAAAEEIGMLDHGVKRVEIYKLDKGEEECPEVLLQAQG